MAGLRVSVPDLVGFGWDEACQMARSTGLQPRAVGPDGQSVNGRGGVVIDQQPAAGERLSRGSPVTLRIAYGGGPAGDREPRDPLPQPQEFTEWLDTPPGADRPGKHSFGRDREPELVGG